MLCTRFDALTALFEDHTASTPVSDERLLYALTESSIIQDITAQHVIMRPAEQSIRLWTPRRLMNPSDGNSVEAD